MSLHKKLSQWAITHISSNSPPSFEKRSILEMLHEHEDCAIKEPKYIELTPAVIKCLKRGLNCWTEQNYTGGSEIRKILDEAEETKLRIAEDV